MPRKVVKAKKKPRATVQVIRSYNMLRVNYCDDLEFNLAIQEKMIVRRTTRIRDRGRFRQEVVEEPVYEKRAMRVGDGHFYVIPIGFYHRLEAIAEELNLKLDFVDKTPATEKQMSRLYVDEKAAASIEWREKQKPIIDDIMTYERGQYQASTGAGKTYAIAMLTRILPRAKILVTAAGVTAVKTLRDAISNAGSYCGILTSKDKDTAGRVLCCTLGMLPHVIDDEWDVLVLDEKHECATVKKMTLLLSVNARYVYAFSANHNERTDGADAWLETLFGECRIRFSYNDALEEQSVAPVEVNWLECKDVLEDRLRHVSALEAYYDKWAYVRNEARNILIANKAMEVSQTGQTLVYVAWVEHAYALQKLLQCPVVHAEQSPDYWTKLRRRGLVTKDMKNPTQDELDALKKQFEEGEIRLAIANNVWSTAVSFDYLEHLIRGDWMGSMRVCRQVAGRLSRKSEGKTVGKLYDICDTFNDSAYSRSNARRLAYEKVGMDQVGWVKR